MVLGEKEMGKAALAPNDPARHTNLPSMAGAKSIATNPTAMPGLPGLPKKMGKAALAPNDPARHTNLPSMAGAKSIATNPTAMPGLPGLPKKMAKAGTGIPAAPKPPGMAAAPKPAGTTAVGPAKPKAPPGSAPAVKAEMPGNPEGLSSSNHNRILIGS